MDYNNMFKVIYSPCIKITYTKCGRIKYQSNIKQPQKAKENSLCDSTLLIEALSGDKHNQCFSVNPDYFVCIYIYTSVYIYMSNACMIVH